MYRLLVAAGESQAIIVSGPSGAGKTETCKLVLKHLAYVTRDSHAKGQSKSSMELGELLVQTNPLLEAFGNASTLLNHNSSRFGKFTQVHVSRSGAILGASIQTYLLEATRVVVHAAGECTYHMYYQLVAGLSSSERSAFGVDADPSKYAYTRSGSGKATERKKFHDDVAGFKESKKVLTQIGVNEQMLNAVFQTLAGLLHLGNIQLGENVNGDSMVVGGTAGLKRTSDLLQTNMALLQQGLTSRTLKTKGQEMQVPLKPDDAKSSRDAMAKAVYAKLFGWVVAQINTALIDPSVKTADHGYLGILDIYGFENFEKNSLEQLFINFANEQLHQHFAVSLFKTEQEIYAREGILWPGVEWDDNSECLEVIAGKGPLSIFNTLSEHSRLPKSDDIKMTEKVHDSHRKSKSLKPPKLSSKSGGKKLTHREAFVLSHFAGEVVYRTDGWLRKNTDTLHEDLQVCLSSSQSPLLAQLFSVGTINAITGGARGGGKRVGYVAEKYNRQLEDLMRSLRATHSHFVRCIKPNHEQQPNRFVDALVLEQLRNSGMVDAVRLLSQGYSTRVPFETLEAQFKPLCPAKFQNLPAPLFCVALLTAFDLGMRPARPPAPRPRPAPRAAAASPASPPSSPSPSRALRLPPRPHQGLLQVGEARVRRLAPRGEEDARRRLLQEDGPPARAVALPPRRLRRPLPALPQRQDAPPPRALEVPPLRHRRRDGRALVDPPRQGDPLRESHRADAGVRPRPGGAAQGAEDARGEARAAGGRPRLPRPRGGPPRQEGARRRDRAQEEGGARAQDPRAEGGDGGEGARRRRAPRRRRRHPEGPHAVGGGEVRPRRRRRHHARRAGGDDGGDRGQLVRGGHRAPRRRRPAQGVGDGRRAGVEGARRQDEVLAEGDGDGLGRLVGRRRVRRLVGAGRHGEHGHLRRLLRRRRQTASSGRRATTTTTTTTTCRRAPTSSSPTRTRRTAAAATAATATASPTRASSSRRRRRSTRRRRPPAGRARRSPRCPTST